MIIEKVEDNINIMRATVRRIECIQYWSRQPVLNANATKNDLPTTTTTTTEAQPAISFITLSHSFDAT